jgi:hypothetical protein
VPDQIVSAFFPNLKLYGFGPGEGRFAELLKTLEKAGATESGEAPRALRIFGIEPA